MDQTPVTSLPRGPRKPQKRLSPDEWAGVFAAIQAGWPTSAVAAHYGVAPSTVNKHVKAQAVRRPVVAPMADAAPVALLSSAVTDLDGARKAAISEIINAFNNKDHGVLKEFARIAEILDRLARKPTIPRASEDAGDTPVFKPGRDVFALLNELGLKPEDVL